jgi:chloramphenicol O-acetyltransferase
MTHFASEITNTRFCLAHEHKNYHMAHFDDSNRAYLCGCMPWIKTKKINISMSDKRNKSARNIKYFFTKTTLWNRTHAPNR